MPTKCQKLIFNYLEVKLNHDPDYKVDTNLLKVSNKEGATVAHFLANRDFIFTDKEILSLSTNEGQSVAHTYARKELMYKNVALDTALNQTDI